MPRQTYDIGNFSGGSIPSADRTNVQPPAMAYILDGDPEPQVGAVSTRRNELLVKAGSPTTNFGPIKNGCALTRNDGKYDIIYHQFDAVKSSPKYAVRALEDFGTSYLSPGSSDLVTLTSSDTDVTFEPINETVRMGYGNSSSTPSRWLGYIRSGQFDGSAPSGIQSTTATLSAPQSLPPLYKIFNLQISSVWYTFGITWEGRRIYKITTDTGYVTYSQEIFSRTQGFCNIDGTYAYVFDYDGANGLGTIYKVKLTDFAIVERYPMTDVVYTNIDLISSETGTTRGTAGIYYSETDIGGVVSDLECTTNYLVFSCYHSTGFGYNGAPMMVIAKSSLSNGVNVTPKAIGPKYGALGAVLGAVQTENINDDYDFKVARQGLFKSSSATEIGLVVENIGFGMPICDGTVPTSDMNLTGEKHNWFLVMNETFLGATYPAMTELNGTNLKAGRLQINTGGLASNVIRSIVSGADGTSWACFDGYVCCASTETSSTYWSMTGIGELPAWTSSTVGLLDMSVGIAGGDKRATYSSDFMNDVNIAYLRTPDNASYLVTMVVAQNQSSGAMFTTRGRIALLSYNDDSKIFDTPPTTYVKTSELNIYCESQDEPPGDGPFTNAKRVFYKASYIYDGYQESPLIGAPVIFDSTAGKSVQVRVLCYKSMSSRVTGINIYRAEGDPNSTSPQGYYRLVKDIDISSSLGWAKTTFESTAWGNYYEYIFNDTGAYGVSFEDNTEINADIADTNVNYKLQCMMGGYHFVANCYSIYYDDATHMLFRSKLNAPDMFDVSREYLHLPVLPTAIAAFAGSVWVFDKTHMYRINPQTLVIEDATSGVGCLGPRAVCVSDSGMFFADEQTIWHFDGSSLQDVGAPIQTAFDSSHINHRARIAAGNAVQLLPWPAQRMVMVFYWGSEMYYYGYSTRAKSWWAYKTVSGIWNGSGSNMLATYTRGAFLDIHRGQIFSASGTTTDGGLVRFWSSAGDPGNIDAFKQLEVYTGGFTAGDQSQLKKLYDIEGDASTAVTLTRAVEGSTGYGSMVFGETFKEMAVKAVLGSGSIITTLRGLSITFRPLIGKR